MLKWYVVVPAVFLLLFLYMFIQSMCFKVRHYNLNAGTGIRFLHLTDIHIGLLHISAKRIRKAIEKATPDYILFSGDFIEKPKEMNKLISWLTDINIKVPAYAVLGNHELRCFEKFPFFKNIFLEAMQKLNIKILSDEVVILDGEKRKSSEDKTCSVALVGLKNYKVGISIDNSIFEGLKTKNKCVVAFSHCPDISLKIPENSVDILIVGHLHGGQIWLPFNLEYLILRKDCVSRMGYYKGFTTIRNNKVYISRGLGTVLFPFRFLSVPEVTVFDI